ncbi:MAG: FmdE family protein [Anaerolineae bacterium]|nr:FmdE family protein [Anaerolineae bacterium]
MRQIPAVKTPTLTTLLDESAALHRHLCPRQVLGVRMGLCGPVWLGLEAPRDDKHLLTIIETDGCAADGVSVATGCTVGRRTLHVMDYGKVAATFVDVRTGQAIRVVPHPGVREAARRLVPDARSRWHAQLEAYQIMPEAALLVVQPVTLTLSLERLISRPGYRVTCEACGEEIINEREVVQQGRVLCQACAGHGYYHVREDVQHDGSRRHPPMNMSTHSHIFAA